MALSHTKQNTIVFAPTAVTAAGSVVFSEVLGHGSLIVVLQGTFTLGQAIFEGTIDNTNWFSIGAALATGGGTFGPTTGGVILADTSSAYMLPIAAGIASVRLRVTTFTSGLMNVSAVAAGGSLSVQTAATALSGGDGALVDGIDATIRATVFDYGNSNPVAVVLRDTNGDYVSVTPTGNVHLLDAITSTPAVIREDGALGVFFSSAVVIGDGNGFLGGAVLRDAAPGATDVALVVRNIPSGTQPVSIATAPVLVAGAAIIGKVGIDQTTPGTTNGVQVNAALPAGANAIGKLAANSGVDIGDVDVTSLPALIAGAAIIGKVGIDQTTPGTTNGVQVNAALPAGANAIGKLAANSGVDIGDVDVTSLPALIAGAAIIGKVGIDQTTPGTTNAVQANAGTNLNTSALALEATQLLQATAALQTSGNASLTTIAALSKAEDAVAADLDTGIATLAVRQDVPQSTTSATGDYAWQTTDAQGRLWVNSDVLGAKFDRMTTLLELIATEIKIQNEVLAAGLNVSDPLNGFRNDPSFAGVAMLN